MGNFRGNFAENLNLGNRFRPPPPPEVALLESLYTIELCTGLENTQTAVVTDASNFQTDVNICLMAVKRPSYCLRILASNLQTDVNLCLIAVETAVLLFKKLASILLLIASVAALAASVGVKNNLTAVRPIAKQPRGSLVA